MNMTRRILEGIHEVELEITPEFQKVDEPEKTTFVVMVNHPDWLKPVKHLGPFDSASDAIESAKNWKNMVQVAKGGKSPEKKKFYSWEVRASDGGSVAKG